MLPLTVILVQDPVEGVASLQLQHPSLRHQARGLHLRRLRELLRAGKTVRPSRGHLVSEREKLEDKTLIKATGLKAIRESSIEAQY